jgi:hypothetical protein
VGKTALLERFQRDLRDARWSWGACDGLFTPRPLGPLCDLADQLGGELLDLCARGADRDELFRALLRQVSGSGPLNVVVVEDVHWADEATMDLLRFAGRRLREARVLVVVTFRDDDLATDDQRQLDRAGEATGACKQALELWRAAGDRLREGDTTRRLSGSLWHLCRGQEAGAAAAAAVALLEPLTPGVELAHAYAELAARLMVPARHEEAIENARRAQSIAEQAGAPAVISSALNTEGVSAALLGREWTGLLDRALQIALDEGLQAEAGRAYCNYYATYCGQRRFAEAEQLYADGIAYCDDHDIATYGTFLRSERTGMLEKTGRWDEALALSLDILDRADPAPITRLCPSTRAGTLLARRGEASAGNTSTRRWLTRNKPANRSRSSRSGWPGPRRAGSKAGPPTPWMRPNGPTRLLTPTTPGATVR